MRSLISLFILSSLTLANVRANLVVKIDEPKRTGQKAVIKLTMKNTFKEKIESARAQVFLVDDQNKTISSGARWVIGSAKDRPPLAPGATTTYNFVVPADKEVKVKQVIFSRIVLEGGKEADPKTVVELDK